MADKFDAAYQLRQKILDCLKKTRTPLSTTEIAERIHFCRDYVCRATRPMLEHEEIKRSGSPGKWVFSALKNETHRADKARKRQTVRVTTKPPKDEPFRYVHKHTDDGDKFMTLSGNVAPKNTNHGGQGAIRNKVYIKSCMG